MISEMRPSREISNRCIDFHVPPRDLPKDCDADQSSALLYWSRASRSSLRRNIRLTWTCIAIPRRNRGVCPG